MPKVQLLPLDVIAKIAAGEVVDRPAAVIKELFENALDSGATSIEVHLKDAGKELIHIKDNGHGISKDDLETIFQRHATSKITSIEDLDQLSSMGFRGEALYSVAAVSDITIKTKHKDNAASGWEINVRGGVRQHLQPAATSSHGTTIEVAELFFNTPARRKFLKNNTSEMGQILNTLLPYALIYPQLRLHVTHAGKSMVDLKPSVNQVDRIAHALNLNTKDLMSISQQYADEQLTLRLTLGNINIQRPRRDLQFIFVNNRPVESKNISFNINDIFKLILPPQTYGCFVVEIFMPPSDIDVNIHPTKREVRLKGEARINSYLRRLAEQCLMQQGAIKQATSSGGWGNQSSLAYETIKYTTSRPAYNQPSQSKQQPIDAPSIEKQDLALFAIDQHLFQNDNGFLTRFRQARYIGQWLNKFLLFEHGTSLLVVDQHAAQERIMYEKFKSQIDHGTIEVQPLLTPILLKLNPLERIAYDEIKDTLTDLGIESTQFDDDTIALHTQPLLLKNLSQNVRSLLAGDGIARCDKDTLARRACKASIVSGDSLAAPQVEHQRQELLNCQDPFTCPHGRPTVIEITENFIDREFLRV